MQRTIDGPEGDWLNERAFADHLNIGLDLFRAFVRDGLVPEPRKWTTKTRLWHWEVVYWTSQGLKLGLLKPKNPETISKDFEGD